MQDARATKAFFISIPHSGERIPPEVTWLNHLPESVLMCDVDRYVDRLYHPVIEQLQLLSLKTEWHRYVVDLNRLPGDVDVDSVEGSQNPTGQFTTGLHWVQTTRGQRLLPKPMRLQLHQSLVAQYYEPFHQSILQTYADFKSQGAAQVYHIDAHSMPSLGTVAHRDPGQTRASIVISDGEGKSCDPWFKDLVIEGYTKAGLQVAYNWPYLGGRVTQVYGRPQLGQHAIQVEINRSLYMDEESKAWLPARAANLSDKLAQAIHYIYDRLPSITQ